MLLSGQAQGDAPKQQCSLSSSCEVNRALSIYISRAVQLLWYCWVCGVVMNVFWFQHILCGVSINRRCGGKNINGKKKPFEGPTLETSKNIWAVTYVCPCRGSEQESGGRGRVVFPNFPGFNRHATHGFPSDCFCD